MLTSSHDPQLLRPSIHHSAVPRRAGRSWADCTRGLGGVTTPCCLLSLRLFEDMTAHLKGKLVFCAQWKVPYYLCRAVVLITRIHKATSVSIREMLLAHSNVAETSPSFPLVPHFFQMARLLARWNRKIFNTNIFALFRAYEGVWPITVSQRGRSHVKRSCSVPMWRCEPTQKCTSQECIHSINCKTWYTYIYIYT